MKLSNQLPDSKAAEFSQNHFFEALKHLTTLDTGSILLVIALLERLFPNPEWKILAGVAIVLLIVSLASAVSLMFWHAGSAEDSLGSLSAAGTAAFTVTFVLAFWAFVGAIAVFAAFALKNLY